MTEMVEISKAELDLLRDGNTVLRSLWNDKEEGLSIKRRAKAKFPELHVPELDTIETVTKPYDQKLSKMEEENKQLRERFDKYEREKIEASEEADFTKDLDSAFKRFSLTEDGKKKAIDRMREKKSVDAEAAAAWVVSQEPKQKPTASSNYLPQSMNLYGSTEQDDKWGDLNKDPVKFADREIANILSDFANGDGNKYVEMGGTV